MTIDKRIEATKRARLLLEQKGEKQPMHFRVYKGDAVELASRLDTDTVMGINTELTSFLPGVISSTEFSRSKGDKDWHYDTNAGWVMNKPNGFVIKTGVCSGVMRENEQGSDMNDPAAHLDYLFGIAKEWYGIDLSNQIPGIVEFMQYDYDRIKEKYISDKNALKEFRRTKPKEMFDVLEANGLAHNHEWLLKQLEEYAEIHSRLKYGQGWHMYRLKESMLANGIPIARNLVLEGSYSEREVRGETNKMEISYLRLVADKQFPVKMDVDCLKKRNFNMLRSVKWGVPLEGRRLDLTHSYGNRLFTGISHSKAEYGPHMSQAYISSKDDFAEQAEKTRVVLEQRLGIKIPA